MEAFNPTLFNPQWIHAAPPDGTGQNTHDATPSHDATAAVQNGHYDAQGAGDDWNKHIDLSDFGLPDLHAQPSSSTISPVQLYQLPAHMAQNGQQYFSPVAPYNMLPYGQAAAWAQQIPLSSYSTLNGATTSISSSNEQQQQSQQQQPPLHQHSPPTPSTQAMNIDPALSGRSDLSRPSYSTPPTSSASPSVTAQQQNAPMAFLSPLQQPMKTQPTMFIHPQQVHQPQQRTLNPQQLNLGYQYIYHHPMTAKTAPPQSPMHTNLTASSSGQPSTSASPVSMKVESITETAPMPPKLSPEERRAEFQKALRPLIAPSAFTAKAVKALVKVINDYGPGEVEPETRVQIASRIRDNAGNAYFRAWTENDDAMVLLSNWLKAGVRDKDDPFSESTMPILHILDRLPLSLAHLKEHRVGKIIKKILKEPEGAVSPAVRDMASNLERKWMSLIEESAAPVPPPKKVVAPIIEDKSKKRKLSEAAAKAAPPAKKALTSAAPQVKVKTEKVIPAKGAKVDASFFSAPKKTKLPSFKKAPLSSTSGAGATTAVPDVAQPSNANPFQEALASMNRGRAGAAGSATPEPGVGNSSAGNTVAGSAVKLIKKRKSVTWASDGLLEKIKIIEKAVYDDDPVQGSHGAHSIRDLERAEGAAMHLSLFEESIDWYEPYSLDFPEDLASNPERGNSSQEKTSQEEREKGTLSALYITAAQIPDSPAEPASQLAPEQVDHDVRHMVVGPEILPFFQETVPATVADLVGQLRTVGGPVAGFAEQLAGTPQAASLNDVVMGDATNTNTAAGLFNGIDLNQLAAQLGIRQFDTPGAAAANGMYTQQQEAWGAYGQQVDGQQHQQQSYADYGYDDQRDRDRDRDRDGKDGPRGGSRGRGRGFGGRGGRGGGDFPKGKSRRLCNFYAAGGCKFGDGCHFSHDGPPGQGY